MIDSQISISSGASIQTAFFQSLNNSPAHQDQAATEPMHFTTSTFSSISATSVNTQGVFYATDALIAQRPSELINSLVEHINPAQVAAAMNGEGVLNIADVADLLHPQHAIITGGRSQEGCPLIIFPDNNNFNLLEEADYQKLILYLSSVPSLLVQLEETERRFDEFWRTHRNRLEQCLRLRMFEQGFRDLQNLFDGHFKAIAEMNEIGESVERVAMLIQETEYFQAMIRTDVERIEEVVHAGQQLIGSRGVYPWEVVQPKCDELQRVRDVIGMRLTKRLDILAKNSELMERVEKVLQRIDDVSLMCDKRIASLKKLALKPPRPVQQVTPEPAVPLQPPGGAPHLLRRKQNKRLMLKDYKS
ncbi:GL11039 [Drosophila persimilis]|uniref:GL11039 n=1 Tax=Drosophila persimilis TaxID=7234 RepID=B4GBJ3_DROPE|nr:GL11039 [Drosophila persimilis]